MADAGNDLINEAVPGVMVYLTLKDYLPNSTFLFTLLIIADPPSS